MHFSKKKKKKSETMLSNSVAENKRAFETALLVAQKLERSPGLAKDLLRRLGGVASGGEKFTMKTLQDMLQSLREPKLPSKTKKRSREKQNDVEQVEEEEEEEEENEEEDVEVVGGGEEEESSSSSSSSSSNDNEHSNNYDVEEALLQNREEFFVLHCAMVKALYRCEGIIKGGATFQATLFSVDVQREIEFGAQGTVLSNSATSKGLVALAKDVKKLLKWQEICRIALRCLGASEAGVAVLGMDDRTLRRHVKLGRLLRSFPLLVQQDHVVSQNIWINQSYLNTKMCLADLFFLYVPLSSPFLLQRKNLMDHGFEVILWSGEIPKDLSGISDAVKEQGEVVLNGGDNCRLMMSPDEDDDFATALKDYLCSHQRYGGVHVWNDAVYLLSLAGCERQPKHQDFGALGEVYDGLPFTDILKSATDALSINLGALMALELGTRLILEEKPFVSRLLDVSGTPAKELYLYPGEICVFRGDIVHAGAAYDQKENLRIHVYGDVLSHQPRRTTKNGANLQMINDDDDEDIEMMQTNVDE